MIKNTQKLSDILCDYFDKRTSKDNHSTLLFENRSMPILPEICSWEVYESPERFGKTFKLSSKQQVVDFLSELIRHEVKAGHEGSLRIEGLNVTVEVYTHDVNKITELDQEYVKNVDFIHRDILDFDRS